MRIFWIGIGMSNTLGLAMENTWKRFTVNIDIITRVFLVKEMDST